jgi:type I restriction enzyme S subunit
MSFPRYPKYKDSGVEWLGEVPEQWQTVRLRHLTTIRKGRLPGESSPSPVSDADLPYLSMEYLRGGTDSPQYVAPSGDLLHANDGDVLLLWDGSNAGEFLRARMGIVSSTIALIENEEIDRDFLFYACKGNERRIKDQTIGMGIPHVSGDVLKATPVPLPSPTEQTAIAAFLDRETAKIDGLVAEQRRLMELLKEKRQAVISHAVTKGLNPDAPMKPSGIEWLGDVPEHWEIQKLKHQCRKITDGEHISPKTLDEGVPLLSAKDVRDRTLTYDVEKFVTPEDAEKFRRRCDPDEGDLLIVSRGATIGRIGFVEESHLFCLMGSVILLKLKPTCVPLFMYFLLNDFRVQTEFTLTSDSSAQQAIYLVDVCDLEMAVPPKEEQVAIAEALENQSHELSSLVAEAQRAVDLLQERRTALISAAVTGQIDVRQLAEKEAA